MIKLAQINECDEIMKIFRKYPKIFPHIRKDKITSQIEKSNVLYDDGVVITFGKYQRRVHLGNIDIHRSSWILHQIVNREQGNGKTAGILKKFLNYIDNDLYLTVRADNVRARNFYEKRGFIEVGEISWKSGEIDGKIYCKKFLVV